jgi:hypothetical protein
LRNAAVWRRSKKVALEGFASPPPFPVAAELPKARTQDAAGSVMAKRV